MEPRSIAEQLHLQSVADGEERLDLADKNGLQALEDSDPDRRVVDMQPFQDHARGGDDQLDREASANPTRVADGTQQKVGIDRPNPTAAPEEEAIDEQIDAKERAKLDAKPSAADPQLAQSTESQMLDATTQSESMDLDA